MLKDTFLSLAKRYSRHEELPETLWKEIELTYTSKKRHYHNLTHLENLLHELQEVKQHIRDWDTLLFTLFYHDIVYNSRKSDNEEQSAELAAKRLTALGVPQHKIDLCYSQILATKSHSVSQDNDTNLFTDADLSILGKEWPVYEEYCRQVRKEYALYPDILYKPGRKKILQHFLQMPHIFKTDLFSRKYETQARLNLGKEIEVLS